MSGMITNEDLARKAAEDIWARPDFLDWFVEVILVAINEATAELQSAFNIIADEQAMEGTRYELLQQKLAERDAEIAQLKQRNNNLWHGMPKVIHEKLAEFSTNDLDETYVDLIDAAIAEIARLREDRDRLDWLETELALLKVAEEALKSIKDYCEADIMYNAQDIDCIHESSRRALATIRSNSS